MQDGLQPIECINLRIRMANRVITRIFDKYARQLGVTPSQQTILLLVDHEGRILQSEIGKALQLERSTVTRELKGLEAKGYLKKEEAGISAMVRLTADGKAFMQDLIPAWVRANEEVAGRLGKKGVEALGTLFGIIRE